MKGLEIKEISKIFNFSTQTIIKQLKSQLGDKEFLKLKGKFNLSKSQIQKNSPYSNDDEKGNYLVELETKEKINKNIDIDLSTQSSYYENTFFEITPLVKGVELEKQKDLTSEPLENAKLPGIVYLLVDKNIELEIKCLKDYPEWSFLPEDDLNRKVIQIFSDQKLAKRSCSKNQKVIKVPNPNVFFIASSILKLKGISRIILEDVILSL